jgi:YVTN family beta-propeller protein
VQPRRAGPDPRYRHRRQPRAPAGGDSLRPPPPCAAQGFREAGPTDRSLAGGRVPAAPRCGLDEAAVGEQTPADRRPDRGPAGRGRHRVRPRPLGRISCSHTRAELDWRDRREGDEHRRATEAHRCAERGDGRRGLHLGGKPGGGDDLARRPATANDPNVGPRWGRGGHRVWRRLSLGGKQGGAGTRPSQPADVQACSANRVGNRPGVVAVGKDAVWVANTIDGTVSRIGPAEGAVTDTIPVGLAPAGIAVGSDAIWVTSEGTNSVVRVDARSRTIVGSVSVGNDPTGVSVGEGASGSPTARTGPSSASIRRPTQSPRHPRSAPIPPSSPQGSAPCGSPTAATEQSAALTGKRVRSRKH